ncbi:MAG: radical SAM protein [Synergistaceae bacterium]|jgi:anaerobic ribonucleoside-triphosphate reductase activating protein|nr:radical SAM protein [Synergistaceae bacterium]
MREKDTAASLHISHYVERTHVLGPFSRSALWVQGCCFSCEGCMAREMHDGEGTRVDCGTLASALSAVAGTEGITISGGEPFLQAGALAVLLHKIRAQRDYGVIIYTGFLYEDLLNRSQKESGISRLLDLTDLLIDGPYEAELDDGKPYRGSSNQRFVRLSERYANVFEAYYNDAQGRKMEINFSRAGTTFVGVPSKSGLDAWRRIRSTRGCLRHG